MFLQNKYTKWYMNIISNAKQTVNRLGDYFEKHHIIPKSLGGSNSKDNLVKLTAREHFIVHLLLLKMLEGDAKRKMSYAMYFLVKRKDKKHVKITSRTFEFIRLQQSKAVSEALTGLKRSKETCEKLSKIAKERCNDVNYVNPFSGEKGSNISSIQNLKRVENGTNPWAGIKGSLLSKRICKDQIATGTHPFQDKKKASERTLKQVELGTHMSQIDHKCPHCEKTGKGWTMFRWHFNNCKHKSVSSLKAEFL
jgi:5-methylcytosine-specific restriction endonuclease McrA